MRKFISLVLMVSVILSLSLNAYAWTDSDIVISGGNEIIVPLQVPEIVIESPFAIDDSIADHNGEYGNVYRGKVDVSAAQKRTKMFSFNNYHFNEGKYKLSMWFMEDPDNSDVLTRMIRPLSNYNDTSTTLKSTSNGYLLFFNSAGEKIIENGEVVGVKYRSDKEIRGVWKKYEIDFMVSSSSNASWLGKPNVGFSWECVGRYEDAGKKYEDKYINGDINVLFSDIKLFKYPSENLSFISTNDNETANEFRAEFSAPVDLNSIQNVTIDGIAKDSSALDMRNDGNTLVITPKGGFAPGRDYKVSLGEITDIFERKYNDEISATISVNDYLDVEYLGIVDNENVFNVKNNMPTEANLIIAVFYYSGNSVKKVSYSAAGTIESGLSDEVAVSIPSSVDGYEVKAQIWDTTMLPMPLAAEISLN